MPGAPWSRLGLVTAAKPVCRVDYRRRAGLRASPSGHTLWLGMRDPIKWVRPRRAVRLSKRGPRTSQSRRAGPAGSCLEGRARCDCLGGGLRLRLGSAGEGGVGLVEELAGSPGCGVDERCRRAVEPGGPELWVLRQDRCDASQCLSGFLAGSRGFGFDVAR